MKTTEILQVLPELSIGERLAIANAALQSTRQVWQTLTPEQKEQHLALSAELAILDYTTDRELTAFTELDGEDFYEYSDEDFAKLDSNA